jgi:hypothetical protein
MDELMLTGEKRLFPRVTIYRYGIPEPRDTAIRDEPNFRARANLCAIKDQLAHPVEDGAEEELMSTTRSKMKMKKASPLCDNQSTPAHYCRVSCLEAVRLPMSA